MKLIVAGSRTFDKVLHFGILVDAIEDNFTNVEEIVSGCCRGADRLGEVYASLSKITIKPFPAKWKRKDGSIDRSAGYKRNVLMAEYGDALLALWDGKSSGTKHMIDIAKERGLLGVVVKIKHNPDDIINPMVSVVQW